MFGPDSPTGFRPIFIPLQGCNLDLAALRPGDQTLAVLVDACRGVSVHHDPAPRVGDHYVVDELPVDGDFARPASVAWRVDGHGRTSLPISARNSLASICCGIAKRTREYTTFPLPTSST